MSLVWSRSGVLCGNIYSISLCFKSFHVASCYKLTKDMHLNNEIEDYNDHHRMFLQNMLMEPVFTKEEAWRCYHRTKLELEASAADSGDENESEEEETQLEEPPQTDEKTFQNFFDVINAKIEPVNMKIKQVLCEATQKKVYVLFTINETNATKVIVEQSSNKLDREFLQKMVKEIVTSPTKSISEITAINLSSQLSDHVTKKEMSLMLVQLLQDNWFTMVNGKVFLGPRMVPEMKKYLQEEYSEHFDICQLCKELTLMGVKCPSSCGLAVHSMCLEAYFGRGASRKCLKCKKPWPEQTNLSPEISEDDSDGAEY